MDSASTSPKRRASLAPPAPAKEFVRRTSLWDSAVGLGGAVRKVVVGGSAIKPVEEPFCPTSNDIEASKAARILRALTIDADDSPVVDLETVTRRGSLSVLKGIPPAARVIQNAKAIAIFTFMRTGSGSGVIVSRLVDDTWSAPSGVLLHVPGREFDFGPDVHDVILIIRTTAALKCFSKARIVLGEEQSIVAGPVEDSLLSEEECKRVEAAEVWSYIKSKGLSGGIIVEGNVMVERMEENTRSYGKGISAVNILNGDIDIPFWCSPLHETLFAAEGKEYTSSKIPWGQSPADSDRPQTQQQRRGSARFAAEDLDDHDMDARREMLEAMRSFGINDPAINDLRYQDPALFHGDHSKSPTEPVSITPELNESNDEDDDGATSQSSSVTSTHFINSFGSRRSSVATSVESDCSPSIPAGFLQGSPRTGGSLSTVRSPRIAGTEELIPEEDESEEAEGSDADRFPMHRDEYGVITFYSTKREERIYPNVEAKTLTYTSDFLEGKVAIEEAFRPVALESSDEDEEEDEMEELDSSEDKSHSISNYTATSVRNLVEKLDQASKTKLS